MSSDNSPRQLASLLRQRKEELVDLIVRRLRASAYDNRYALHPRRLASLGAAFVEALTEFADTHDERGAFSFGHDAAGEGMGEKTVIGLVSTLRRFCSTANGHVPPAVPSCPDEVEEFCAPFLEGYMKAREAQILSDQEQLRRALSTALVSQGHELMIKNSAITTSISGIVLAGLDGAITYVNQSFCALWGLASPADAVGKSVSDLWVGEDAAGIRAALFASGGWRGEITVPRADTASLSIELTVSPIRDESGAAIGIMSSFMDVTERKRLQSQVIQAQKMEALGQLAGGIAHDFNNLLTAISGYLQLLLIDAPRESPMHQDLMQINAAVDRGTALTRQLRFFTRQATGSRQAVSLNEIARETLEIITHTFPPQISIELSLSPSLWTVEADPNQVSQVLVNLCVNARDAMMERPGAGRGQSPGGTLTIETSNVELSPAEAAMHANAHAGKYAVLRVRDTGTGISPEIRDKLFEPFVTTKTARSGTGLGLAVVYGIVVGHRGFLDVESQAGKGSVFGVFLPMSGLPVQAAAPAGPAPLLARGEGTILVVDDEPQVREIITRVLTGCGYTVIEAEDGRAALERYGRGDGIDLVILDLVMPGMGGRKCLARLRAVNPNARVLIATGYTGDGLNRELLEAGVAGIIEKPLQLPAFAMAVRSALGGAARAC